MHNAKIDFLIVFTSVITLRFVASAFLITNILETTPVRKSKFFAKVIGPKRSSKQSLQKNCKILDDVFMQRRVVLEISENAANAKGKGNFFLEKKNYNFAERI